MFLIKSTHPEPKAEGRNGRWRDWRERMRKILIILSIISLGCSTVPEYPKADVVNISLDDVKILLSKKLTIHELYTKIGSPIRPKNNSNWGNISYKLADGQYLYFWYKGEYIVSAKYGRTVLKGILPKIYKLSWSYKVSKQNNIRHRIFSYLISGHSFSDYDDLKKYMLTMPEKSIVEYQSTCIVSFKNQPFISIEQIEDFKSFCKKNNIILIWYPGS
jgi:hypothetical protein